MFLLSMTGKEGTAPSEDSIVVEASRFNSGIMVAFSDGSYAFFPAHFLQQHAGEMPHSSSGAAVEIAYE